MDAAVNRLRDQISRTESRLEELRCQLATMEEEQRRSHRNPTANHHQPERHSIPQPMPSCHLTSPAQANGDSAWPLPASDYKRYGRQLILPQIGLHGQLNLNQASVLIVGLGGLGCPAAAYLAGAGIATIGLMDGDIVELSNLHRQILHTSSSEGEYKVDSAARSLHELNPHPQYVVYREHLRPEHALSRFEQYDLILDCTDHPTSRYLISDAAVLAGKPLVSASALGMEGQLLVLNDEYPVKGNQPGKYCYRCVFPRPPSPDAVLSCSEGGILGPVVGVMGVLMATAALKILARNRKPPTHDDTGGFKSPPDQPSMLLYSADNEPMFRTVRIKGKRDACPSCGINRTITQESLTSGSLDYVAFCGRREATNLLKPGQRITPTQFLEFQRMTPRGRCILVDVRGETEYELGHVQGSINVPIRHFSAGTAPSPVLDRFIHSTSPNCDHQRDHDITPTDVSIFTICRHSNDSQVAARSIQDRYPNCKFVGDIKGGIEAWRKEVDPSFPDY
ncbi:MAG: hypothetical protein L6R39_001492 [Caloplaca ligustica]|nr:MAG: hypothetical protein L6R39_001492 [Caloplaca ligustica]